MSAEEKMSIDERRKYIRKIKKRYQQANRHARSQLLNEMQAVTELHRTLVAPARVVKSLVRLLASDLARKPRRQQRGRTYGLAVHNAVRVIAESCDYICAERLQPNLVWLAEHLAEHRELETSPALLEQLEHISVSTVRRIQRRLEQDHRGCRAKALSAPTALLVTSRCNASLGTYNNLATSRSTWCTTAVPARAASTCIPCRWSTSPPAGANGWRCSDVLMSL